MKSPITITKPEPRQISGETVYTITDESHTLIKCEFNWKNRFVVNYKWEYFDTYYEKVMSTTIEKEFETLAEAKEYCSENN